MSKTERNLEIVFVGSHAGVSIGPDGPSQMGLEDLALFRTLPGAAVLYPSDAMATERLGEETRALITVEDHYAEGGLGEAVAAAVPGAELYILAVILRLIF